MKTAFAISMRRRMGMTHSMGQPVVLLLLLLDSAWCDDPTCDDDNLTAAALRPRLPPATLDDITLTPNSSARAIFAKYGALVVRGLAVGHAPIIRDAAESAFEHSVALMEAGHLTPVQNDENFVGWVTPDQTLFIPAPEGHVRPKQAMVLALDYHSDASMLQSATAPRTLDLLGEITGWDHMELFGKGQCFYKEPISSARSLGGIDSAMAGPRAAIDARIGAGVKPGGNPKCNASVFGLTLCQFLCQSTDYCMRTTPRLDPRAVRRFAPGLGVLHVRFLRDRVGASH